MERIILYTHTKFYIPSSNCLVVIAVKLKDEWTSCMIIMLFYIVPKTVIMSSSICVDGGIVVLENCIVVRK
jgi:hypothetical protein